jgi:hypothetical protein
VQVCYLGHTVRNVELNISRLGSFPKFVHIQYKTKHGRKDFLAVSTCHIYIFDK